MALSGLDSLNLNEEVVGLTDLIEKAVEIVEVGLDLLDGEVDKQTSDLSSFLLSDHPVDILVDVLSRHILVVRVLLENGRPEIETTDVVLVGGRVSARQRPLNVTRHVRNDDLGCSGLLRGSNLRLSRCHDLLGSSGRGSSILLVLLLTLRAG